MLESHKNRFVGLLDSIVSISPMSASIAPAENDDDCECLKGIASIVDSNESPESISIERPEYNDRLPETIDCLPEKNEESEQVETEIPTDNIQKYLPLIRAITGRQLGHSSCILC